MEAALDVPRNTTIKRSLNGVSSVVWILGGYALLLRFFNNGPFLPEFLSTLVIFSAWLGGGVLLAVAGIRRGNLAGRIGGGLGLLAIICVAWPMVGPLVGYRAPISEHDRRKYYGDAFIYHGAPFCCIYVGLETNHDAVFENTFWQFAGQHGIHRPQKHYGGYSGPRLATCKSDHVSVFFYTQPTSYIEEWHNRLAKVLADEPVNWVDGLYEYAYWPTNASRVVKNGKEMQAQFTGSIFIGSNDTNYTSNDFRQLTETLANLLRSSFPDRSVNVFSYNGDKK